MRDWSNGFQNKYCFKLTNAAGRIFIGALCVGPQLAVLVAAGVGVLGAQETRVALLVALDPEVAAERLFRFGEAAARFCQAMHHRRESCRRIGLVAQGSMGHRLMVGQRTLTP